MNNETNSETILALVYRIERIILPILIIFGSLCNILTFIVMRRRRMRVSSTCFYMAALAVTDTLVLWTGCLNQWFYLIHLQTFVVKSNLTCKLLPFLFLLFADASVWIIVCMSFERYFAVSKPLRASQTCTTRRAKWVLVVVFAIFTLIDGHFLITLQLEVFDDGHRVCQPKDWAQYFVGRIFVFIDALKYSGIPFCLLLLLSIMIIQRVFHAEGISAQLQNLRQLHHYRQYSLTSSPNLAGRSSSLAIHPVQASLLSNTRVSRRVTLMLLSISIAFCVFSAPMSLMQIVQSISNPDSNGTLLAMGKAVAELCQYVNHSCNFFLYALTGRIFRREFVRVFFPTRFGGGTGSHFKAPGMICKVQNGRASLIPQPAQLTHHRASLYSVDDDRHHRSLYRASQHLPPSYFKQYNHPSNKQHQQSYTVKSPLLYESKSLLSINKQKKDKSFIRTNVNVEMDDSSLSTFWNIIGRKKERRQTNDGTFLFVNFLQPTNTKPSSV